MSEKIYLKYSKEVKLITLTVGAAILASFIALGVKGRDLWAYYKGHTLSFAALITILLFTLAVILYYTLRAPRYYVRTDEALHIKFLVGSKTFPFKDYHIEEVGTDAIASANRLFGSGGYMGYLGIFQVPGKGKCNFYVTNRKGSLLMLKNKTNGKYTFVSK